MQNNIKKILDKMMLVIVSAIIVSGFVVSFEKYTELKNKLAEVEAANKALIERTETIERMKKFVFKQMAVKKVKFSEGKKDNIAQDLAEVVADIFERDDHRMGYITMVGMESSFNTYAQSPTGPKGMAQTAKAAFFEGLAACSDLKYDHEDVWIGRIGLLAGACYYKRMLGPDIADGDPFTAGLAYNQGPASEDVKTWKKSGFIKPGEGDNYIKKMLAHSKPVITFQE